MVYLVIILINLGLFFFYLLLKKKGERGRRFKSIVAQSGSAFAYRYLQNYVLLDVKVESFHKSFYDWRKKTVHLREDLFDENNLTAIAVAAHESSHALQGRKKTLLSILRIFSFGLRNLSLGLSVLFLILGYFSLIKITLSVASLYYIFTFFHELEANHYAMAFIEETNEFPSKEIKRMKHILFCFLSSYLVNFLSVLTLLYVLWFLAI